MANVKGYGIKVEVAKTFGTPIAINSVSASDPGVVTETAHGLLGNAVGYFSGVSGMALLELQAIRVRNPTTDNFVLQELNTTNYGVWNSGNLTMVTAWETLAEAKGYSISGGAGEKLDVSRLISTQKEEEQGQRPAANVSMEIIAQDTPTAALKLLNNLAATQGGTVVRITLGNGAVRLFYGEPSQPGESVAAGQVGSGSLDFAVKGLVIFAPA